MTSSRKVSRRTLTKGAAWAAPIVAATAAVPAYAASSSTPKNYMFGRQGVSGYTQANRYGTCTSNQAFFTTANMKQRLGSNALPWNNGHGIVYAAGQGEDTTATLNSYTIRVAYPKKSTSGNWRIDNSAWTVKKLEGVTTFETENLDGYRSFDVSNYDIYEFTFNSPTTAPVYQLGANDNEWPGGKFTAIDDTPIEDCYTGSLPAGYIQYSWNYTTANGFSNYGTDATTFKMSSSM